MAKKWTPPPTDTPVQDTQWTPPSTDEVVKKKDSSEDLESGLTPSIPGGYSDQGFLDPTKHDVFTPSFLTKSGRDNYLQDQQNQKEEDEANLTGIYNTAKNAYDENHGAGASDAIQNMATHRPQDVITGKAGDDNISALGNLFPQLTAATNKSVSSTLSGVTGFIRNMPALLGNDFTPPALNDKDGNPTDYAKNLETAKDPLGALILGLNGIKHGAQELSDTHKLPDNLGYNIAGGAINIAPDLAALSLIPEAKAPELIEGAASAAPTAIQTLGKYIWNPFTKLMIGKGAAQAYADAQEHGENVGDSDIAALKGAAEGGYGGATMGILGGVAGKLSEGAMDGLIKDGLIKPGQQLVTNYALKLLSNATVFGGESIASTLAGGGSWDEAVKEGETQAGIGALFGLKEGIDEHGHVKDRAQADGEAAELNDKQIRDIVNGRQVNALRNFQAATPEAIAEAHHNPTEIGDLNAKALQYADQASKETDPDKKGQLTLLAQTFAKTSDVKGVTDLILNNKEELLNSIQQSEIPDAGKEALINKINITAEALHPDAIAQRDVEQQKTQLSAVIAGHDVQIQHINDQMANTTDDAEKQEHTVRLNDVIANRVKAQTDLFNLTQNGEVQPESTENTNAEPVQPENEPRPELKPMAITGEPSLEGTYIVGYDRAKGTIQIRDTDGSIDTYDSSTLTIPGQTIIDYLEGKGNGYPGDHADVDIPESKPAPPKEPAKNEFEQKLQDATDPKQVAAMYDDHLSDIKNNLDIDGAVADYNGRMSRADFERYGDKSHITTAIARNYFERKNSEQKYIPLDLQADEINERYFNSHEVVGPEDIVDFAVRHPGGHDTYFTPAGNEELEAINNRHLEMTGKNLNKRTARKYADEYHVSRKAAEEVADRIDNPQNDERVKRNIAELLQTEGLTGEIDPEYLQTEFDRYLADHTNEFNIFYPVYEGRLPDENEINTFKSILDENTKDSGQTGAPVEELPTEVGGGEPAQPEGEGTADAEPGGYNASTTEPERVRAEYDTRINDLDDQIEKAGREFSNAQKNIDTNNDMFASAGVDDGKKTDTLFKEPANLSQENVDRILKPISDKISRLKSDRAELLDEQEKAIDQAMRQSSFLYDQARLSGSGKSKLNPEEIAFARDAMTGVFPNIQTRYYDHVADFEKALAKSPLKDTISRGSMVHAFVDKDRVIHFNPLELAKDTQIHEQGHILTSWARVNSPELYKQMIKAGSEMSRVHEMLRANGYNLNGHALHEEAFVTALGRDGAKKLKDIIKSDTQRAGVKKLIQDAWTKFERWITEKTGYSLSRGKSIKDMTFGDFVDMINDKYLLSGTKISDLSSEELAKRTKELQTNAQASPIANPGINGIDAERKRFRSEAFYSLHELKRLTAEKADLDQYEKVGGELPDWLKDEIKYFGETLDGKKKTVEERLPKVTDYYKSVKKELKSLRPSERGNKYIIKKLGEATSSGKISKESANLGIELLNKNPYLFKDLAINLTSKDDEFASGNYNANKMLVTIFKRNRNTTLVHELLHHTERFLPDDVRIGILKEWAKNLIKKTTELQKQLKNENDPVERGKIAEGIIYLGLAEKLQSEPDQENKNDIRALMKESLKKGLRTGEYYQYFTPSEWWATHASDKFLERSKSSKTSWVDTARSWYNQFMSSVKNVFGINRTEHVERGLNEIMKGNPLEQNGDILLNRSGTGFLNDIADNKDERPKPVRDPGESLKDYAERVAEWKQDTIDNKEPTPPQEITGNTNQTNAFGNDWTLEPETKTESVQRKIQDAMNRAKKAQDAIKEAGGTIDKESDYYNHQRRIVGITEHELDKVNEELFKSKNKQEPALFEKMKAGGINEEDFGRYLYAKHAAERNAANASDREMAFDKEKARLTARLQSATDRDRKRDITYYKNRITSLEENKSLKYPLMPDGGSGMTNAQAQDILQKLDEKGLTPKLEALGKEFKEKVTGKQLKNDLDSGRISQEEYDRLNERYEHYVPLQVEEHVTGKKGGTTASRIIKVADAFKKSKGAVHRDFNQRINPAKYGPIQLEKSIIEGEKNRVVNTMRNLVEQNPNPAVWEVIRPRYKAVYNADGTIDKIDEITDPKIIRESIKGFQEGKPFYIHVKDDILRRQIKQEWKGKEGAQKIINAIGAVTGLFRNTATIYNPAFWAKNIVKDNFSAIYNLNTKDIDGLASKFEKNIPASFKGVYQYKKGIRDTPEAKMFERYLESGAMVSYSRFSLDTDKLAKMGEYFDDLHEKSYNPVVLAKKVGDYMSHVSELLELTTRVSAFSAAVQSGVPDHEAAIISKEATIDFAQKGEWSSVMNSLYLFSNAGIQGSTTFFKNFANSPAAASKVIGGMVAIGIMAAAYNHHTNGNPEDDKTGASDWKDYFRVNDFDKQGNILIRNPLSGGFFKIPTGHELGLYGYLGDKLYNVAIGKEKGASASLDMAKYAFQAYTPFQGSTIGQGLTPNILKPVIQLEENKNSFGSPIFNEANYNSNTPQSQLHFKNTNPIYVNLANQIHKATGGNGAENGVVEIPPEAIKFAFETTFGGAGKTAAQAVDFLANSVMLKPTEIRNIPILYSFYTTGNDKNYKANVSAILSDSRKNAVNDIDRNKFYMDAMKAVLKNEITDKKYESMVKEFQKNQERINLGRRFPNATTEELKEMMKE